MPLQEGFHNQADQVLIGKAPEAREKAKIGMFGVEAGQWVDLDELRPAGRIIAHIDAAVVAAFLVLETIVGPRGFARRRDLEDTEHTCTLPCPRDADGELAPGEIGLDEDGLTKTSEQLEGDLPQTRGLVHPRARIDAFA